MYNSCFSKKKKKKEKITLDRVLLHLPSKKADKIKNQKFLSSRTK